MVSTTPCQISSWHLKRQGEKNHAVLIGFKETGKFIAYFVAEVVLPC